MKIVIDTDDIDGLKDQASTIAAELEAAELEVKQLRFKHDLLKAALTEIEVFPERPAASLEQPKDLRGQVDAFRDRLIDLQRNQKRKRNRVYINRPERHRLLVRMFNDMPDTFVVETFVNRAAHICGDSTCRLFLIRQMKKGQLYRKVEPNCSPTKKPYFYSKKPATESSPVAETLVLTSV